jgi:hypothetical protein
MLHFTVRREERSTGFKKSPTQGAVYLTSHYFLSSDTYAIRIRIEYVGIYLTGCLPYYAGFYPTNVLSFYND